MTEVINDENGELVVVRFLYHQKEVQFITFGDNVTVCKTVEMPHKVLTGKILGRLMVTVGTEPESVHFVDVIDGSAVTQLLSVQLGCLCSLAIHPSLAMVAVVTTAGLPVSLLHQLRPICHIGHLFIFKRNEPDLDWTNASNVKAHKGEKGNTCAVRFSPCGEFLATAQFGSKKDSTWRVWKMVGSEGMLCS